MLDLSILVVHDDPARVKAALKQINWPKLNLRLAAVLRDGDAALTLMGQQTYHIVFADASLCCADGSPFLPLAAARHPESLFWVIGDPVGDAPRLLPMLRMENVCDYIDGALRPDEIIAALKRGQVTCSRHLMGRAVDQLLDLNAFHIPAALKKNIRATLRSILKDAGESNLNALAQDVSILFHEVLIPHTPEDMAVSKAAAVELIFHLRYHLLAQNLECGDEFVPRAFIEKIQCAITNEDLEDICLYYLRRGVHIISPNGSTAQVSALVRSAYQITRLRYADPSFTLVSLSDEIGISPNYLSSVFKMETGIRFKKYLNSYRMEQAKELLMDSRYKIYEVANLVGIEDSRYFSQIFRTYTGLKPSEYRNACTAGEGVVEP